MQNSDQLKKLTPNTEEHLYKLTSGFFDAKSFDKLLSTINNSIQELYFTNSSESNFIRVINSIYDKVSFFSEALEHPHYLEYILQLVSSSNFLTDILVMNPEFIYLIYNNNFILKDLTARNLKSEITELTRRFKNYDTKLRMVKTFQRKHILRIAVRDIIHKIELENITHELSILANTISEHVFELIIHDIYSKHGLTLRSKRYALISLGKLGGMELNYSSDLDFILIYDKNSNLGRSKNISLFQLLNDAIEQFIKDLSIPNEKGFLYRIDFRLRPDGKNSPLCRSINDTVKYYEIRGEDWERQMLLKMNLTAGNKNLFENFKNSLAQFIFPGSFSESPLIQISKMKETIEVNTRNEKDIKRGKGGIRDIEFLVQALQLINGKKIPMLRTSNTINALKLLHENSFLNEYEFTTLYKSYVFFRRIEHFLQLLNNQQTHSLPENREALGKLAYFMGFKNYKDLLQILTEYRTEVRTIFDNLTENENKDQVDYPDFENPNRAMQNFEYLRRGKNILGEKHFDKRTIDLFKNIEPSLINLISSFPNKDFTLEQFVKLVKSQTHKSIFYKEFQDFRLLKAVITLCSKSAYVIEKISLNKYLAEQLLTRNLFSYWDNETLLKSSLEEVIVSQSIKTILNIITVQEFSKILSKTIDLKLSQLFTEKNLNNNYLICGLGSYGIKETSFFSDIDIILFINNEIYEDEDIINKIKNLFYPLEVDLRLRPEGAKGPKFITLKNFEKYLDARIRPWELLSYTKLRYVAGNKGLYNSVIKLISDKLDGYDKIILLNDLIKARKLFFSNKLNYFNNIDIKNGYGSLKDIDFFIRIILLLTEKFEEYCGISNYELPEKFNILNKFKNIKTYSKILKLDFFIKQFTNQNKSVIYERNDYRGIIKNAMGSDFDLNRLKLLLQDYKKEIEEELKNYEKIN